MFVCVCCVGDLGRRSSDGASALVNSFAQQLHNKEMAALSQTDAQDDGGQAVRGFHVSMVISVSWTAPQSLI